MSNDNDEVRIPQVGEIWRHWKGAHYEIVSIPSHERDGSLHVVYRAANGNEWVRPLWEFIQNVTIKGGLQVQRYTIVQRTHDKTDLLPHQDTNPAPPIAVPLSIDGTEVPA
jgi:hypothetical protein